MPSVAARKAGAALFLLWSVLHIWVPLEGYRVYAAEGNAGAWHMVTGGSVGTCEEIYCWYSQGRVAPVATHRPCKHASAAR
jgi:hypothetical protein